MWQEWVEQYERKDTEKDKKASDIQVAMLLKLLWPDATFIYRSFEWAADVDNNERGRRL